MRNTRKILLLAASVAGLTMAATGANAQSAYERASYNDGYYNGTEEVIVVGPRRGERSNTGRPIRTVQASRDVSFADLDLRTEYGADRLIRRIKSTARTLCNRLDTMHPVTADNSPPCYENAVYDAMEQADDAIARARGG